MPNASLVQKTCGMLGSASAVSLATIALAAASPADRPPALITASVKVSPRVDHPSAGIKVSGSGFAANEAVDVYFDTTDEILAVTDSSGAFGSDPMTVPAGALPGTHWITAVGRRDGVAAQKAFTVRTDWPELGFSPRGKRANPYENVLTPDTVSSLDTAWSQQTGDNVNASPAVVNGNLYVSSNDHNLYAFNATTGARLWSAPLGDYSNSSPAVANGAIYVGANDGKLYAFNVKTGALLWTATTGAEIESSPAVADGAVYVGSDDANLYAFDATSGSKLWSTGAPAKVTVSPAVANGIVYIDTANDLFAYDAANGTQLWHDGGIPFDASPAVANDTLFVGANGSLYAVDATSGNPLWAQSIGGSMIAPSVANGVVYAGSTNGSLYAFDAANGAALWSESLGHAITSAPSVAGGVVYVAATPNAQHENELFALDAATGAALWGMPMSGEIQSAPTVANGMLYFGSDDYSLYALALDGDAHAADRRSAGPPSLSALHVDWRLKPSR